MCLAPMKEYFLYDGARRIWKGRIPTFKLIKNKK